MRTTFVTDPPIEVEDWLAQRKAFGQDLYDEVWGDARGDRTDRGSTRGPTAAIVGEVVSPGDESRRKLGFYFRVGVEEVLIVDPVAASVEWFRRGGDTFEATDRSALVGITRTDLADAIGLA